MGTRNITSVISGGKQVVCQYGQWDGYPTWTGVKVLKFLRDSDINRFKKALENTKITVVDYENANTYTGSTKHIQNLFDKVYKKQTELNKDRKPDSYITSMDTVKYMLENNLITESEADEYIVSTRDTGCDILPYIYNRSLNAEPLELFALIDEFNGDYAWDIQGVYKIDLDKRNILMTYDGYSREYSFDSLPKDIDKEMLIFEKMIYHLYMVKEEGFISRASGKSDNEKGSGNLWDMAIDIALSIGKEIKESNPEMFSDIDEPICVKDFGLNEIYKILCDEFPQKLQPSKSVSDLLDEIFEKYQNASASESPPQEEQARE